VPETAPPEDEADVGVFYDALAPYGGWVVIAPYGRCWVPRVAVGWRPYDDDGYWGYTDVGMVWVSDYPWGWVGFHYGRWFLSPRFGWCWVPGRIWAPNWCAWRWGDEWCGWAPLPPSVRFDFSIGLRIGGADLDILIEPSWWRCVRHGFLFEHGIHRHVEPFTRNVTIINKTKNITKIVIRDKRVVADSVREDRLERALGHRVEARKLAEADAPEHAGPRGEAGNELRVYRPEEHGKTAREARRGTRQPTPNVVAPEEQGKTAREARRAARQPTPNVLPPEEQRRRSEDHARNYDQYLQSQRQEMERRHREELARPPRGTPPEELSRSHREEQRILEDHARRQQAGRQPEGERRTQGRGREGGGEQGSRDERGRDDRGRQGQGGRD
jgi:hypothetical protein